MHQKLNCFLLLVLMFLLYHYKVFAENWVSFGKDKDCKQVQAYLDLDSVLRKNTIVYYRVKIFSNKESSQKEREVWGEVLKFHIAVNAIDCSRKLLAVTAVSGYRQDESLVKSYKRLPEQYNWQAVSNSGLEEQFQIICKK